MGINITAKIKSKRRNARLRGLEFDIDVSDMKRLMSSGHCEYTNSNFDRTLNSPRHRTIERVDNTLGYIRGNLLPVTLEANNIKERCIEHLNDINDLNIDQLKSLNKIKNVIGNKEELKKRLLKYWDESDVELVLSHMNLDGKNHERVCKCSLAK